MYYPSVVVGEQAVQLGSSGLGVQDTVVIGRVVGKGWTSGMAQSALKVGSPCHLYPLHMAASSQEDFLYCSWKPPGEVVQGKSAWFYGHF